MKIEGKGFSDWIVKEEGEERKIVSNFEGYRRNKLRGGFNEE